MKRNPNSKLAETFKVGAAGLQDCFYALVEEFDLEPNANSGTVQNRPVNTSLATVVQHLGSGGAGLVSLVADITADIKDHLQRFQLGSRDWVFDAYFEWLKQSPGNVGDKQERQRAFIIYGDAGVGKSTIAARLARMPAEDTHIKTYHFCKHNDQK